MYKRDLAVIHEEGFGELARRSAPGLLRILRQHGIFTGLVVDLGCGTGIWAAELVRAGYRMLGIDISRSMVSIAKKKVPHAEFRIGTFSRGKLPSCNAVTALGECLNYISEENRNPERFFALFQRVYRALNPGGIFVFDIAEPGQIPKGVLVKSFTQTDEWSILVLKKEERKILTRWITTYRKFGKSFRRSEEIHRQVLLRRKDVARGLREAGFRVSVANSYGKFQLPPGRTAFIAVKAEIPG